MKINLKLKFSEITDISSHIQKELPFVNLATLGIDGKVTTSADRNLRTKAPIWNKARRIPQSKKLSQDATTEVVNFKYTSDGFKFTVQPDLNSVEHLKWVLGGTGWGPTSRNGKIYPQNGPYLRFYDNWGNTITVGRVRGQKPNPFDDLAMHETYLDAGSELQKLSTIITGIFP
jgi:hypothetical protein